MEMRAEIATAAVDLDTPCVTILLDRLEKNIDRVQRIGSMDDYFRIWHWFHRFSMAGRTKYPPSPPCR